MKKNLLSVIAIAFSLIAIGVAIWNVTPFEITNDTYIGATATFIGISVTLLIGYQIYNALEIRKDVSEIRKKSEELDRLIAEQQIAHENQKNEMLSGFDMTSALITFIEKSPTYGIESFYHQHKAIIFSLKTNRTEYEGMLRNLRIFMSEIDSKNFPRNENDKGGIKDRVNKYLIEIDKDEETIRKDKNFCRIKMEYDRVMKLYRKRIAEIKGNPEKQLTKAEKDTIINS